METSSAPSSGRMQPSNPARGSLQRANTAVPLEQVQQRRLSQQQQTPAMTALSLDEAAPLAALATPLNPQRSRSGSATKLKKHHTNRDDDHKVLTLDFRCVKCNKLRLCPFADTFFHVSLLVTKLT